MDFCGLNYGETAGSKVGFPERHLSHTQEMGFVAAKATTDTISNVKEIISAAIMLYRMIFLI